MTNDRTPPSTLGRQLLAAARHDTSWLVRMGDDDPRTLTTREIVDAYNERLIDPDTYVWTDGMRTWQELQTVSAIVEALHAEVAHERASEPTRLEPRQAADRHENSAIFSLAMLVGDRQPKEAAATTTDDSGLIDLAALTAPAGPAPTSTTGQGGLPSGGLFPEAPVAIAEPRPSAPRPAARNDRRLVLGLGATAMALLCALVFQIVRMPQELPPSAALTEDSSSPAETQPAPPVAVAEPVPTAAEGVAEESRAEPAPSAASAVPPGISPPLSKRPPVTGRPPATTSKTPSPPPAPTTAAKGCPCPVDDLMCQMRCATRK